MAHNFVLGDYYYSIIPDDKGKPRYYPARILDIETWPDGSLVWQITMYAALDYVPKESEIDNFEEFVRSAPLAADPNAHFITHRELTFDDLKLYKDSSQPESNPAQYSIAHQQSANEFYRLALESAEAGKIVEASDMLDTAAELSPEIYTARRFYEDANRLADKEKYAQAIELYEAATRIDPDFIEAFEQLGLAYIAIGDPEMAIGAFEEVLAIDPERKGIEERLNKLKG